MAFEQTLKAVQAARAISTTFACLAVIFFSFVIKLRRSSRQAFLDELKHEHGDLFEIGEPTQSAWGGLALVGLAVSIAWNGFSFIDLCIKKHYRFDRRVCIFVDILIALLLLVTGFLTFMYDAVLFIALQIATSTQIKLEIAATTCLGLSCLFHIAFFCYGCKDPEVAALSFEHVPMQMGSPGMGSNGDYEGVRTTRSRSNTKGSESGEGLMEIDLGKKVQMTVRMQPTREPSSHTPPKTPSDDSKRFGHVGMPPRVTTPQTEQTSFLKSVQTTDWI